MSSITLEGGRPLVGEINVSGAKNAALKAIFASLFSNEDILLENVPRVTSILHDLEFIERIGGFVKWTGSNTLTVNGSSINTFEVPYELGSKVRTSLLLAGPLLFRFGKVRIPKYSPGGFKPGPINRYLETWENLGVKIEEGDFYYLLDAEEIKPGNITFRVPTHMGTDNAILSSIFVEGETVINNASEEIEVDSLIEFCNLIGGNVVRVEPRKIVVSGTNIFKGGRYKIEPDKTEVAAFATLAIITNGNIIIKSVDRPAMIPFVNFLTKIDARYEFVEEGLKVWHDGKPLKNIDMVTIAPTPGLIPDWKTLITLLLTKADGESIIHDTVYVERNEYVRDLNRMGAKIEILKPGDVGIDPVISDDSYDLETRGEPETVLKVTGPVKLRGEKLHIENTLFGAVLLLAALMAEGKSDISGMDNVDYHYEKFVEKLQKLGAKIISYERTD